MSRGRLTRPRCAWAHPSRRVRCGPTGKGGFTLLEVALAVLVLGTALVALTRMLTLGRLCSDADATRVAALQILREQAELVKARGYDGVSEAAATAVEGHAGYTRSIAASYVGGGLKRVTVTVSWDSPTGTTASESVSFLIGDSVLPVRTWEVRE
jgi:Tfp pilus assembly protein PilV